MKFLSEQSHKCVKFIHLITFISRTHYIGNLLLVRFSPADENYPSKPLKFPGIGSLWGFLKMLDPQVTMGFQY